MGENNLKVKLSAKGQNLEQNGNLSFDQHKFISNIYECEKQQYILENRKSVLKNKMLGPRRLAFKETWEYSNYCKEIKKKKAFPKQVNKPVFDSNDILDAVITTGIVPGAIIGLIINIIIDIIISHIIL